MKRLRDMLRRRRVRPPTMEERYVCEDEYPADLPHFGERAAEQIVAADHEPMEGQPEQEATYAVYILPTEEGVPPRALLIKQILPGIGVATGDDVAVWTADVGTWTLHGMPLPQAAADAITAQARELGVDL